MKYVCGLNPLCICFETTCATDLGQINLDNLSKMGIDVIHFKKNYPVYQKMVVESFKRVGDEMWPNHIGIFTIPVMFAVKFNIPLIIWGENSQQEYGGHLLTDAPHLSAAATGAAVAMTISDHRALVADL